MKKQELLTMLKNTFEKDAKLKRKRITKDDGSNFEAIYYNNKSFLSPTKMLTYKSKQLYEESATHFKNYAIALQKGKDYHRLFSISTFFTPKNISEEDKKFLEALQVIYKKNGITPIINEYILWDEKAMIMCVVDCIGLDSDGNIVIIELKTFKHIDIKKELISHFQTYIAQSIIKSKLKKDSKAYTIHWDGTMMSMKGGQINVNKKLENLKNHFQAIINTEIAWKDAVEEIAKQRNIKKAGHNFVQRLKERDQKNGTN